MPSSSSSEVTGLSLYLRAPSREVIEKCFSVLFTHRHDAPHFSAEALRQLFSLSDEESELLCMSSGHLLRRILYESSELATVESVKALMPKGLDVRLESLLSDVLFSALPHFRDAAVDQRVGLPRLENVAWRVQAMNSNTFVASANEAALLLKLSVRDQPGQDGVMAQLRELNLAVSPASLGSLLEGMRRIKDQLGAFS